MGRGSYKDGASFLLASNARDTAEQIVFADPELTEAIDRQMTSAHVGHHRALGFTSPVYYFQKVGLLRSLLAFPLDAEKAPGFVEMEEAPFFVTARPAGMKAASMVVGSDRAVRRAIPCSRNSTTATSMRCWRSPRGKPSRRCRRDINVTLPSASS
jgi:purine-nucleoside phosphorylase